MFRRLLIANRGEVAARIARACDGLGIEPVFVYSTADRDAPWLSGARRTVCIGSARPEASYLDADSILQAAEQTGCQAIHPGWGFLAENAVFAARCEQQGLGFVGPSATLIRTMGSKALAKRTAADAGLPTVPGSAGPLAGLEQARREAQRIGYPVLLKAVAGGGGRGMRRCDDPGQLGDAFAQAAREAQAAFGDPSLYLEKLVAHGRHVEFQVLCDAAGHAVHLGERECSIQRKHQKLVEESPSPAVDAKVRARMGKRVAEAMRRLGYRNAGTVEFLLDPEGNFYFMEMNTRLQVEHAVTEMVTGIDLVAEQLRVACNEPLRLRQAAIGIAGHAIEFRINAEDPERGFRPDPGEIRSLRLPAPRIDGAAIRWDSAIDVGYRIPAHYDSMLGKLIVHAATRAEVIARSGQALDQLRIEGVRTTVGLHRSLLAAEPFQSGAYDIEFLGQSGLLPG